MRFGVNIPNYGPTASPDTMLASVRHAEDLGLDVAMLSDHIAVTPDVAAQYPAPFYEPLTALAWLAGRTERIRLGTTVLIMPYRDPLLTARVTANLDRYSAGRLVLGVGIGWAEQEFAALKVDYAERGRITDEYLAALRTLWTEDIATFEGTHVSFRDVQTAPRPSQSPHPPIWIGGNSPAAIRRAVRHGDTWHPLGVTTAWLEKQGLPALRQAAEQAGRPTPTVALRTPLRITTTPATDADRLPGEGTIAQIEADLAALATLGIENILLDTRYGDAERLRPPTQDQADLESIAHLLPPHHP
ncbi:TIGR03619 family F420-dependent LLM class oxidoreductase [Embleya sp. NBC_00896]|uniref:TIGR03619 family F420-dependent LLM class oxidoreductase n=1 Tax=Embleya sp. NBC_00896 TaxID=2975961 RepID=UPI003867683C|nr:TIGR03619 family F420-dependent LLM class oxidoreductase [Embleya sp. NBC_00896]